MNTNIIELRINKAVKKVIIVATLIFLVSAYENLSLLAKTLNINAGIKLTN